MAYGDLLPVHVVLQFHLYWAVPRGLILVVVFIFRCLCKKERRNGAMKIVCYIARLTDRAKFLVGNGAPSSFSCRQDVNAIQRAAQFTSYVMHTKSHYIHCVYRKNAGIGVMEWLFFRRAHRYFREDRRYFSVSQDSLSSGLTYRYSRISKYLVNYVFFF